MKKLLVFGLIAVLTILIASCAQPTPQTVIQTVTVIETVEVVKEGQTVIETVEVIKEIEVESHPTDWQYWLWLWRTLATNNPRRKFPFPE